MISQPVQPETIDQYIKSFPKEIRERLSEIRKIVRSEAPEAIEKISYGMPAFTLDGILLYFAAFKNHIGFYPMPSAIIAFKDELSQYKTAKGSIQFPNNKPFPYDLIKQITAFRVSENIIKSELKAGKKRKSKTK